VYLPIEEAEIVDMLENLKDESRNTRMAEEAPESPVSDEEQIAASEVVEPEIVEPEPIAGQETEEAAEIEVEEEVSEVEEGEAEDLAVMAEEDLDMEGGEEEGIQDSTDFQRLEDYADKIEQAGATMNAAWYTANMIEGTLQNLLVDTGLAKSMGEAWEYAPNFEGVDEIITPEGKKARGLWNYTQNLIQLATSQVESTAPHETIHWARQLAYDFGVNETEEFKKVFKGVEEWAGVKNGNWDKGS